MNIDSMKGAVEHIDQIISEEEESLMIAEQQRDLVYNFCKEYLLENGYEIEESTQERDNKNEGENTYEDVTGEKQMISKDELAEMESVIYSISFGKQKHEKRITY